MVQDGSARWLSLLHRQDNQLPRGAAQWGACISTAAQHSEGSLQQWSAPRLQNGGAMFRRGGDTLLAVCGRGRTCYPIRWAESRVFIGAVFAKSGQGA